MVDRLGAKCGHDFTGTVQCVNVMGHVNEASVKRYGTFR